MRGRADSTATLFAQKGGAGQGRSPEAPEIGQNHRMTAADERELRDELERVQQLNKELRGELAELKAFSIEELLERIHELEAQNAELRARLERADEVRESWDRRHHLLRLELDAARTEQARLKKLLETARDERNLGRRSLFPWRQR